MYIIVLFHTDTPWAEGAFIAVNLFFVLSGYLVTMVILAEIDRTGRLDLGKFYARRVRRLLPAALVAIVGISVLFVLVEPVAKRVAVVGDATASLLYFANWRFIQQSTDYFAAEADKSPFLHFWTLSIEEQFYVAFPLALVLLLARGGRRAVVAGVVATMTLSLAAQFFWAAREPMHAYFGTDARAYQLLAGVLLALVFAWTRVSLTPQQARHLAGWGLFGFLLLCTSLVPVSQALRGVLGTVAAVAVVAGLMLAEDQPLGRLMSRPIPVYLGQLSYATYLWHWPAILVLPKFLDVGAVELALLAAVAATAMAAASAELVELPVRRAKRLDRHHWRVVLAGLSVSVLAAVAAVPAVLSLDRKPKLVAEGARPGNAAPVQGELESLPEKVDWDRVKSRKGTETSCGPDDPSECVIHRGGKAHILVVGDSHGVMMGDMFRALARKHDFTLSMNVVLGCPWQENLKNLQSPPKRQDECTAARSGWYDEVLPKLDPDLVVLVGYPREAEQRWGKLIEQRDGRDDPLEVATLRATRQTMTKLDERVERVLLVRTIATSGFDPNDCATSRNDLSRCVVPVPSEPSTADAAYIADATEKDGLFSVDLNPAFCPAAPLCHPVVDGEVAWRDQLHFTPDFTRKRAGPVWSRIKDSGALQGTGL
jgi:peptidoglycan/LPS O-acetylase OafA/YrhL